MPPLQNLKAIDASTSSSSTSSSSSSEHPPQQDVISSLLQHFRPLHKKGAKNVMKNAHPHNNKRKKGVVFAQQVQVYPYITREELTHEEQHDMWYSKEELASLQQENSALIQSLMHPHRHHPLQKNSVIPCLRGLEYRTGMGARLRKENRVYALQAVLSYQYQCWESKQSINVKLLAHTYQDYTRHSAQMAQRLGQQDAHEVAFFDLATPTSEEEQEQQEKELFTTKPSIVPNHKRKSELPDPFQAPRTARVRSRRLHRLPSTSLLPPPPTTSPSVTTPPTTSPSRIVVAA